MTLEDFYFISQIIATGAVLGSLIYLALQTRHAARSSRALMHENRASTVLRHLEMTTDAEFHPIWVRGILGATDMSENEILRFTQQAGGWVVMWEERYRQMKEGMLDAKRWETSEHTISAMMKLPGFRAVIQLIRPRLDPEFRALLDKHAEIGRLTHPVNPATAWRAAVVEEIAARPSATT